MIRARNNPPLTRDPPKNCVNQGIRIVAFSAIGFEASKLLRIDSGITFCNINVLKYNKI